MKGFSKEIYNLKLSVTTDCNMNCDYCFVAKDSQYMDYDTAKKSVDFFVESPWDKKILRIYGWEPFLHLSLLEKIIPYTYTKSLDLWKDVIITICTNGTLINKKILDFLKKYKVHIALSFDWMEGSHDKFRKFKNWTGSHKFLQEKALFILRNYPPDSITAAFDIHPSNTGDMYRNFLFLIKLWFDCVNIAPISWIEWNDRQIMDYDDNLKKIFRIILISINSKRPLFLCTINRELRYDELSKAKESCIFFRSFEVFSNGDIYFSPFLYNFSEDKSPFILGNFKENGLKEHFFHCHYSSSSDECKGCEERYCKSDMDYNVWVVVGKRNNYSISIANLIKKKSFIDKGYKDYYLRGLAKSPF